MPIPLLKNTSISKKLYFTIGIMAVLILIEICVLGFALSTLSSIRAYVNGEALWSKAQRDASMQLRLYAYSGDDEYYKSFLRNLSVPMGDRQARIALEKPVPDIEAAKAGLLQGHNHPDDIDGMIKLLLRFGHNPYISRTINYWRKAETSLQKLIPVSRQLHLAFKSGAFNDNETKDYIKQIKNISAEIAPAEDGFSVTLGEGSRWLEQMVLRTLMAVALTVEITGIIIALSISKNIRKGLGSIITVAQRLAGGKLDERVVMKSADEIGQLAATFNTMADHLQNTIEQFKTSETKLRSFFDSTLACHVLLDKDLRMLYYNKASVEFARKHYHHEVRQGMPVEEWVQANRREHFVQNCHTAMDGQIVQVEIPITYVSGESYWWSLTFAGAYNTDGEVIGVSYHAVDITERVQQESEIRSHNALLKEIAFIQSHSIRRPVASILGLMNVFEADEWIVDQEGLTMLKAATLELDNNIRNITDMIHEDELSEGVKSGKSAIKI
ncbi:HAMP domain-containing protein [Mucilaginibacter sp. CSA2-8R]|uniref:HAMP domain-containing protein n=1 Tax=Mucilaginibacter sp. CSA2-8R TaxID=3141542 RepID=UPI00315CB5C8